MSAISALENRLAKKTAKATVDPRAWAGIKQEAMRAPGEASPWLTMSRAAQGNQNITQMNNLAKKSAWGGMPTGEAAVGNVLNQNISGQAQAYGGQAAQDVGLQRGAEEQRQSWLKAAPGAFNDLQFANKFNLDQATGMDEIANRTEQSKYQRGAKTAAADLMARGYQDPNFARERR